MENRVRRFAFLLSALSLALVSLPSWGDTVVLRDGTSYSGQLTGTEVITFTDTHGVKYTFLLKDVHSLAFTENGATVTLKNGRSYSGKYTGAHPVPFAGSGGIDYQFPESDIRVLVLMEPEKLATLPRDKVIPFGTEIAIRSDEWIDSSTSRPGQLYSATIVNEVRDSAGAVAIPEGTPAKLVVQQIKGGGAAGTPELILALYSIDLHGKQYRVMTSDEVEKGRAGLGANKRTLEFAGGGAGLGAMFGGIFGGGKGAGIGAASGAVAGGLTQLFTRGKQVKVPAEAEMYFRLDQTLVLRPRE